MTFYLAKLAIGSISIFASTTAALAVDCGTIEPATERRPCFEAQAARSKSTPQAPKVPSSLTPAMRDLRSKLDKAFLTAGINMDVMALSKKDQFTAGKLPQLVLFGYLNRVTVYQIITKLDLIDEARRAGFQSLDMFSKTEGHWTFDLSSSGRTCAKDLCF